MHRIQSGLTVQKVLMPQKSPGFFVASSLVLAGFLHFAVAAPALAESTQTQEATTTASLLSTPVSFNQARAIALAQFPGTRLVYGERTREAGVLAWDMKLNNGIAVYINAQTGAVIKQERWRGGVVTPPPAPITLAQARNIALAQYPGTRVVRHQRLREAGVLVWQMRLDNGMAVYLHGRTGEIIRHERWRRAGTTPPATTVSFQRALNIALAQYPGTRLVKGELTREEGILAWDMMLSNGMAVYIDANTGAIIEHERWRW